jgi:hypothetical protein
LQLSTAEFWGLTPFEFRLLGEAYWEAEDRADARIGMLAALYANTHRKKGKKAYKVEDFMPRRRAQTPEKKQSWQQMLGIAAQITKFYGGKVPDKVSALLAPEKGSN